MNHTRLLALLVGQAGAPCCRRDRKRNMCRVCCVHVVHTDEQVRAQALTHMQALQEGAIL